MKNLILTLVVISSISISNIYGQEDKKAAKARKEVSEAKKNVAEAQMDLREAKIDSAINFQEFKKNAEAIIAQNQDAIAELKAQKWNDNKMANKKYNKKVNALEQKNNDLKKKIDRSVTTKTNKWTEFKREFNHDMEELGKAIKDIGINNTK
ncbi:MAG: hypothetical protein ACK4NY_21670 [Spirosomataceae bacterium]